MGATFFDEFWPYPEISGQVFLLVKSKKDRTLLTKLIEKGDTLAIEDWIATTHPDDVVARLLRLGIPNPDDFSNALFDEILIGTRCFEDGAGTIDFILSRRVGPKFYHRVYNDGDGAVVYESETDAPLTRDEFKELTTYPTPWEESGFEDEIADSSVSSIWDGRGRAAKLPPPLPTHAEMLDLVGRLQREGRMPSLEQLQDAIVAATADAATKKRKR
jgi:hypothetical protein